MTTGLFELLELFSTFFLSVIFCYIIELLVIFRITGIVIVLLVIEILLILLRFDCDAFIVTLFLVLDVFELIGPFTLFVVFPGIMILLLLLEVRLDTLLKILVEMLKLDV